MKLVAGPAARPLTPGRRRGRAPLAAAAVLACGALLTSACGASSSGGQAAGMC